MHHFIFGHQWLQAGLLASSLAVATAKGVTPILPLGFMFNWNDPQVSPVPIPITEQCETIHITWSRSTATGPNPVAPYYLQVFTSNSTVPFVVPAGNQLQFDWEVPFAPGTQYQICMYDSLGTTGGCQAMYTVIPPSNPVLSSTCTNLTSVKLDVVAIDHTGPLSRFGFTDQCTDISVTPQNGVPPFTLTVAPPLHPPYNITSFNMNPINWTLSLNWAMPFFIGLSDSNGSMWSYGPLHAAGGGTIGCLAGNVTSRHQVGVPVAVGITFVMLILGAMVGVGGASALTAYRRRKLDNFVPLSEGGALETRDSQRRPRPFPTADEQEQDPSKQVYVLHHDSNMAPVTIIHQGGTNVVELPPMYPNTPRQSAAPADHQGVLSAPSRTDSSRSGVALTEQERRETNHYNPRGPWQPRRPTGIRKPSDPGPP